MINFLYPRFAESVTSSSVAEDDYPATNLISRDRVKSALGFMAYRVTKPPVELEFNFIVAADIRKIRIWNSSGTLISTGFDIYTKCNDEFVKVASASNLTCDIVSFFRNAEDTFSDTSLLETHTEPFFNSNTARNALDSVKCLKVVIKSTKKSPPLIRKMEVWGLPAKDVDKVEFNKILDSWTNTVTPVIEIEDDSDDPSAVDENTEQKEQEKNPKKHPEEFLDAITCELMTFPMILPSGKIVDQQTIEKHTKTEEKWGRPPSDPFTGQAFTTERKPVFDSALKSRIDKYLLENANSEEIKKLPRTVGKRHITIQKANISADPEESSPKRFKLDISAKLNFQGSTDLRQLIQNAINQMIRYNRPASTSTSSSIEQNTTCIKCKSSELLYTINKCNHIVCKSCAKILLEEGKCVCKESFKAADIMRYHT